VPSAALWHPWSQARLGQACGMVAAPSGSPPTSHFRPILNRHTNRDSLQCTAASWHREPRTRGAPMRPSLLQHPREFQAPVGGVPTTPTGYHQWHRSLAAELGRFASRDPVGYLARCVNLLTYVFDSPANKTDSFGLEPADPIQSQTSTQLIEDYSVRTAVDAQSARWPTMSPAPEAQSAVGWIWIFRRRPPIVIPTKGDFFDRRCWSYCTEKFPNPSDELAGCLVFCADANRLAKKLCTGKCEGLWRTCMAETKSDTQRKNCLTLYRLICPDGHSAAE
jgi:hypothetical protein